MHFISTNPATGRKICSYKKHSKHELEQKLARAQATFQAWRRSSLATRAKTLRALARELRRSQNINARLIVSEMGKPLMQARAEVEKSALNCEFYARHGPRFLANDHPAGAPVHRYVAYRPMGVILAIMPWNFPFWQVFRSAAPALLAGNTMLLKHAANVSGSALAIERIFLRAGAPAGLLQSILVDGPRASALLKDDRIAMVTMTGSTTAGRIVAALAGSAMKKGVFELGGSDPYLILADADLAHAAKVSAASRLYNNGQSCIAAKRFIVVEKVRLEFERLFVEEMSSRSIGDPRSIDSEIGPLAHASLRAKLHSSVRESVRLGARILLGGQLPIGPGCYYPATVLTDVTADMPAYQQELFGPVAAIISAKDSADAIRIANDTIYGLGAVVFTKNKRYGERIAREHLECGSAFVNECVRSHPTLPFGGTKQSGHGRELGLYGLREFVNVKTISVT